MESSVQLHASAALPSEKEPLVPIEQEDYVGSRAHMHAAEKAKISSPPPNLPEIESPFNP
jgi:hypothetical protein